MWVVLSVKRDLNVSVLGLNQKVPLVFADGMVGALPVFETEAAAKKWARGTDVLEIQSITKE